MFFFLFIIYHKNKSKAHSVFQSGFSPVCAVDTSANVERKVNFFYILYKIMRERIFFKHLQKFEKITGKRV